VLQRARLRGARGDLRQEPCRGPAPSRADATFAATGWLFVAAQVPQETLPISRKAHKPRYDIKMGSRPILLARRWFEGKVNDWSSMPTISIIDDDESVRVAIKSLLSSLGWTVDAFGSAEEFLNSPRGNDSACLVVDVQMPRMSGVELQRVLKARGQSVPIIFVTAFPEEGVRDQLMKAGAVGFLSKPFDDQSLIKCLDRALSRANDA
jgi:CheY-like chemotaxis protein